MSILSNLTRRLDALGDRVNPIVVKESRQAVRSRAVVAVLSLFIITLLIGAMIILLFANDDLSLQRDPQGWRTFLTFNGILLVVCGIFVPIYVAIRAAGDKTGVAADLLFTTTLKPAAVIRGKLAAGMLVTMLLFATATPFVTVSYLLRGIDLPTIGYWLAFDLVIIFAAVQVAVFLAVLPTSIVIRVILGLLGLIGSVQIVGGIFSWISWQGVSSISQFDLEDWLANAAALTTILLGVGLLFTLSTSCVAPSTSNRAFLPRVYISIAIVVSYLIFALMAAIMNDTEIVMFWHGCWLVVLLAATLISSGERRDPGARVLHSKMLRYRLLRPIGILHSSGCFAGLLWCGIMSSVLIVGLVYFETVTSLLGGSYSSMFLEEEVGNLAVMSAISVLMAIAYNLMAIGLRDGLLRKFSKGTVMTPAITMLLIAAVSIFPLILVALLGDSRDLDAEGLSFLNPVSAMIWQDSEAHGTRIFVAIIMLVVGLLVASRSLGKVMSIYRESKEDVRYGPLPAPVAPAAATAPEPTPESAPAPAAPPQSEPDA